MGLGTTGFIVNDSRFLLSSKEPWLGITYDRKQATTEKEEQLLRYGEKENRVSRSSQPGLPPVAITANRSPLYCDSVDWDRTRRSHMNVVTRTQFPLLTKRSLPKCTGALPYPLPGFKVLNRSHCPVVFDSSKLAARVLARTTDPVPLRRNPTAERAPRLTARPTTRPLRRLNPVALARSLGRLRHKATYTQPRKEAYRHPRILSH